MATEVQNYEGALDKGLEGVVACTTSVSSIIENTLNFRGYTIEDLSQNASFEEVVYLLWNDKLPNKSELAAFRADLDKEMKLDAAFIQVLKGIPTKVHPMAWLRSAVSLLAHWDVDANDNSHAANLRKSLKLTAKMSSIVCAYDAIRNGKDPVQPVAGKSIAWNFMYMLGGGKEPDAELVKIFDTCLVLHADHELNCSAFATRVTASSLSDLHSAVVSAIGALKGPLHGGANEQVILMLKKIGTLEKAQQFVKDALDAKEKVMGIGHRVYKNGDPRAALLRKFSEKLTQKIGEPQWYQMSSLIDDTMYKEKGLMPNVDFYSATVYYSMKIPTDLFTPVFAISRIAGWCAHAFEQYANNRIYRPRGKWNGKNGLKWQDLDKR
ncbi:MAG: citrate synthase [Bdellovibrionaceae bacterium]|nr:citrate synthase [Pseudobdellovibrionaceae bacterium]NUM57182.1 citrate synthase [Pseudobdellovibrionaceae bacterium]